MILRARHVQIHFPRPTVIMGVVNVTPDSFSDGGRFLEPGAAVDHALQLVEEGAEIVDVGGESTRPSAAPVTEAEELRRVMPVLEALAGRIRALISIDTYKPEVARQAVRAGVSIINDTGASLQDGSGMWSIVADSGAAYVAMHMRGTPQTMQLSPEYSDVRLEVGEFFEGQLSKLASAGVHPEQVMLDAGIGFGKTRDHNIELLAGLKTFTRFGRPLVLGVSRKSFLGKWGGAVPEERLAAALAVSSLAVSAGVQIIRTHDVKPTVQAVRMAEEIVEKTQSQA